VRPARAKGVHERLVLVRHVFRNALIPVLSLLLAIAIMAALGARTENVIVALSVVYLPRVARLVRGQVLVVRELMYIEAARAMGAGVPPEVPAWGNMLQDGVRVMNVAPWLSVMPGLAIAVTVLGLNLLGDGLRDCLDPRLHEG
jgi:peptide/nickel transport system permease protein